MNGATKKYFAALFAAVLTLVFSASLFAGESYTFWKCTRDRFNRYVLVDGMVVPPGMDPYTFLAEHLQFSDWMMRKNREANILAEKSKVGKVPILSLHKIGDDADYALTSERFRQLLKYINTHNWYMVADYQYILGDFSHVPTGYKPIVLGADDASAGNVIYETQGDKLFSSTKSFFGKPRLDKNSMAAILEQYARRENGHINFTFYVSFDAVPFRQLDGYRNPGYPYEDIPIVADKIHYLDENFILGIHSLSHVYAYTMGPEAFAKDVKAAWELLDDYAGGKAESVRTLAFPYGISPLSDEMREAVTSIEQKGRQLVGAFDLDNKLAQAPGHSPDPFCVSRINLDNTSWDSILELLDSAESVVARREFIWETDKKRLPKDIKSLGADKSDGIWVLVREDMSNENMLAKKQN